jgi:hypothetical protein
MTYISNHILKSQILFWDTRSQSVAGKKKENEIILLNVPETFKHLTNWRPLLKVNLPCTELGGDFAPTKFSVAERQGNKTAS